MRKIELVIIILLMFNISSWSQNLTINDSIVEKKYPYRLPIWGQKAYDKGYGDQMQLPLGFNVNYVNAFIDMEITEFTLNVDGFDLGDIINSETLNFTDVSATTNGVNFRGDLWLFPFMNVYGLFSKVKGGTNVSLQPTWKDGLGEILLQLPEFSASVDFDAIAYGFGSTFVFGYQNYFLSTDINYSATKTELLDNQVGIFCLSLRLGRKFNLSKKNPDLNLAGYVGVMNRDFIGADGSSGSIKFNEIFPDLDATFNEQITEKISNNTDIINGLNPILNSDEIIKLKAKNLALERIQTSVNESEAFSKSINYSIKKEMIQTYTFQFGFNLQLNKHWMFRGEYGVSDSQRFIMTGLQYRFGLLK
tara:strand:+ start:169 stop:1257 length:1089 start_codon:yes stop_codon:yes gene_type:complete